VMLCVVVKCYAVATTARSLTSWLLVAVTVLLCKQLHVGLPFGVVASYSNVMVAALSRHVYDCISFCL
jgi:hypothetical protein